MKFRLLLLLIFLSSFAMSQVKFEAKTSKTQLGVNERLRIDFTMNEDGDNFMPPSFENFKVVGGPSQSINNSWINSVRSFSKATPTSYLPQKEELLQLDNQALKLMVTHIKLRQYKLQSPLLLKFLKTQMTQIILLQKASI